MLERVSDWIAEHVLGYTMCLHAALVPARCDIARYRLTQ